VPGILIKEQEKEQDSLFKALPDAPVMHVNGTSARAMAAIAMSLYATTVQ